VPPTSDARPPTDDDSAFEPEVVVTCLKRRFTGVSGTVNALLPWLAADLRVAYVGEPLPGAELAARLHPERFRKVGLATAIGYARAARRRGRPLVWHVRRNHELLLAVTLRDVARLPVRVLFTSAAIRRHSLFPRLLIARADAVIATTPAAAELVPNVVATIGHGVDTERFRPAPDRDAAWREAGLPGRHGILVSGRLRREKGTHVFLEAMLRLLPRHPDWTAVLAGLCQPEDTAFLAPYRAAIERAGLGDRVRFLGEIPPAEMPAWYARCLVTAACPLYEGYGLTVIEAMASGAAVVASRTGAFESMVEEGRSGTLVAPDDAAALAAALEPLLADPSRSAAMGAAGRVLAVEHFSIAGEARGIAAVVRGLGEAGERREASSTKSPGPAREAEARDA
jgi:mannosyltransferase